MRYLGVLLFFVVLGTGYYGYRICDPEDGFWHTLYKSVQHFALTSEMTCAIDPSAGAGSGQTAINLSRFGAAFLLIFAAVRLLSSSIWTYCKLWTQSLNLFGDRHVLIGYGAVNQEIARERVSKGCRLTIVARSFDDAAKAFAARYRIVLVDRDIRDENALQGLFLHRAHRVIIAAGDDSLTMETAQIVSGILKARQPEARTKDVVFAHFTNAEVHRQLQLTSDAGIKAERGYQGFAIREETARYFFARTWLAERAVRAQPAPGQARPQLHLVVVGAGDLGMAMTREAVIHGCSARLGRPKVTVVDRDRSGGRDRFRAVMPHLFDGTLPPEDCPDIQFVQCLAEDLCQEDLKDGVPITAWILCCTDDATNMALAMRLESEMRRGLRPPAPIYPRVWQSNVRDGGRHRIGQEDPWHLVAPFGGMQDVIPTLSILDDTWGDIAKSIHAHYDATVQDNLRKSGLSDVLRQYGPPPWGPEDGPPEPDRARLTAAWHNERQRFRGAWADLTDDAKLANQDAAYQAALRLWELGFDWKTRHRGGLPTLGHAAIDRIFAPERLADLGPETSLGAVCAAEHRRWMVERAMRGWSAVKPGERRRNAMKLHVDFRPYAELYDLARHPAAPEALTAPERAANAQRLDAASLRGIVAALEQVEQGYPAREVTLPDSVPLLDIPRLPENSAVMVIDVTTPPSFAPPTDAEGPEAEARARAEAEAYAKRAVACVESLRSWARPNTDAPSQDRAFAIHLRETAEGAFAHSLHRAAFERLLEICHAYDVALSVAHTDLTQARAAIARDMSGEGPETRKDTTETP
ncbi:hypothetical protein [Dinoroseobacter sp. S375]|uniref:hypothetical protein n=1 Tax=Dinoroseobacter sp. S375 TaxID=3415136 RepID=UPI003C79740C